MPSRHFSHPIRMPIHTAQSMAALSIVGAGIAIAACGSSHHTGPATTGNLTVTITTPTGVQGAVNVTGPQGFHQLLRATQTLTRVPVGTYLIVADSVTTPDSIVGTRTDTGAVTNASVTVTSNQSGNSSVTYTFAHRHGSMWLSDAGGLQIFEYPPESIRVSGAPTPEDAVGGFNGPNGMVFDTSGNLWVVSTGLHTVKMLTPAQRAAGGTPSSLLTLSDTGIHHPVSLAMDHSGNLWVSSSKQLRAYTPAQLAAGGAQSAAIVIDDSLFVQAAGMAFDSAGAWVANCVSGAVSGTLFRFTAAQLSASGRPAPVDTIKGDSASKSLDCPADIAYDGNGNLWVLNFDGASIVSFAPAQLMASGRPVPQTKLTLPATSEPWGMAFDHHGALWVGDFQHNVVYVISPSQQSTSGPVTPVLTLTAPGGGAGASFVIFDPAAPDPVGSGKTARIRPYPGSPLARPARSAAASHRFGLHPEPNLH